jgi:multidrug resistance efflux pump
MGKAILIRFVAAFAALATFSALSTYSSPVSASAEKARAAKVLATDTPADAVRNASPPEAVIQAQRRQVLRERDALRDQIGHAGRALGHQQVELERHRLLVERGFLSRSRLSQIEAATADQAAQVEGLNVDLAVAEQRLIEIDWRLVAMRDAAGTPARRVRS